MSNPLISTHTCAYQGIKNVSRVLFSQKNSILDVYPGSKYTSDTLSKITQISTFYTKVKSSHAFMSIGKETVKTFF